MNPDPVWSIVNWVHLSYAEPLSIQRLGVRYRLHPLVVEDLVYREDRAKVDKYKTHLLITIPLISYHPYHDSVMEFMLADGSQEELNLDSYVSPLSLPGDLDRPRKLASMNTPIQHHQSFIDHTTYTMDSSQSQLSHLVIEPLNIVFVFTNPWTKSSHAVLTFTQQEEKEMWEYMNRLISNKNNRGRIEGGSYMVYALLDYVVRSIALHNIKVDSYVDVLKSFAEEIRQVELTVDKSSSIYQVWMLFGIQIIVSIIVKRVRFISESNPTSPYNHI